MARRTLEIARVLFEYDGTGEENSLILAQNQAAKVTARTDDGWCFGVSEGEWGWFPTSYCEIVVNLSKTITQELLRVAEILESKEWRVYWIDDDQLYFVNKLTKETTTVPPRSNSYQKVEFIFTSPKKGIDSTKKTSMRFSQLKRKLASLKNPISKTNSSQIRHYMEPTTPKCDHQTLVQGGHQTPIQITNSYPPSNCSSQIQYYAQFSANPSKNCNKDKLILSHSPIAPVRQKKIGPLFAINQIETFNDVRNTHYNTENYGKNINNKNTSRPKLKNISEAINRKLRRAKSQCNYETIDRVDSHSEPLGENNVNDSLEKVGEFWEDGLFFPSKTVFKDKQLKFENHFWTSKNSNLTGLSKLEQNYISKIDQMEKITRFFALRAKAEREYASNLERIGEINLDLPDQSSLNSAFQELMSENKFAARSHRNFAENITTKFYVPLDTFLNDYNINIRNRYIDSQRLTQLRLKELSENIQPLQNSNLNANVLRNCLADRRNGSTQPLADMEKLYAISREVRSVQSAQYIQEYNRILECFKEKHIEACRLMENIENERTNLLKRVMQDYYTHQKISLEEMTQQTSKCKKSFEAVNNNTDRVNLIKILGSPKKTPVRITEQWTPH